MTRTELIALAESSTSTDLVTAGRAYGMGASLSYELHRRGEFPVRVLRLGRKLRVSTTELVQSLGITVDELAS